MVRSAERNRRQQPMSAPTQSKGSVKSSRLPISRLALKSPITQTKLTVNKPGDKYEQEADAVARAVTHTPTATLPQPDENRASIQRMEADTASEEPIQRMADEDETVQREPMEDEEPVQREPMADEDTADVEGEEPIQRKGSGIPLVSASTAAIIRSPGLGLPLPDSIRQRIEPHLGVNLSGVQIYTDARAQQAATSLRARAFTYGNRIFLNRSESSHNLGLMAHEATHVVQQGAAKQLANTPQTDVPVRPRRIASSSQTQSNSPSTPPQSADTSVAIAQTQEIPNQETLPEVSQPLAAQVTAMPPPAADGSQAAGSGLPTDPPAASAPASPETDPAFQAVVKRSKGIAKQQRKHNTAKSESNKAQAAAVSPASEITSKAQDRQVQELDQQEPGTFDADAFLNDLLAKINAVIPSTEKGAKEFVKNNKLDSVKQTVSAKVSTEKQQAASAIETKNQAAPDKSGIEPKKVTPLTEAKAGPAPMGLKANKAAPKPKTDYEVSQPLQKNSQQLDQQMAAAEMTDQQLAQSNEPQFTTALKSKQEAQTHAKTGPAAYRKEEQAILSQAKNQAQQTGKQQLAAMHGQRGKLLGQVMTQQVTTKGQDEKARAKVASDINGIYEKTKTDVTTILDGLDKAVTDKFDAGAKVAKTEFEKTVKDGIKAFNENRYGSWYNVFGYGNRIRDSFGMPPEYDRIFVIGRDKYVAEIKTALKGIAEHVTQQLNKAKERIAKGREEIKTYVDKLDPSLKEVGQAASKAIQAKFDQLESQVKDKQTQLITSLTQKYKKNLQAIDERIEALKRENQGWIGQAKALLEEVAKTIQKLRQMLLKVVGDAIATIQAILKDPIKFLSNLIAGVKQGFQNFVKNIVKHLQGGLIAWLTGALGPIGIEMPKDIFSLQGIFSLVTQILGLTWDFVRRKAVKLFGEKTVAVMEKAVEIIQILRKDGPAGLWKYLKDQFNDLKESVLGEIKNLVIFQVIQAGVKWVLGLLNPASAFVKAAMLIYDIVMFFVNQGSQILELVKTIVDSLAAIASGSVGAVAQKIEEVLVRILPVVIGFLASALGLGSLAKKVQEIVGRIRKRVEDAIDKLLLKVRQAFRRKKGGKGKALTHKQMAKAAANALKKHHKKQLKYEQLRKKLVKEARKQEGRYNKLLKKPIKMKILFEDPSKDIKDKDLDFKVRVAPNDEEILEQLEIDLSNEDLIAAHNNIINSSHPVAGNYLKTGLRSLRNSIDNDSDNLYKKTNGDLKQNYGKLSVIIEFFEAGLYQENFLKAKGKSRSSPGNKVGLLWTKPLTTDKNDIGANSMLKAWGNLNKESAINALKANWNDSTREESEKQKFKDGLDPYNPNTATSTDTSSLFMNLSTAIHRAPVFSKSMAAMKTSVFKGDHHPNVESHFKGELFDYFSGNAPTGLLAYILEIDDLQKKLRDFANRIGNPARDERESNWAGVFATPGKQIKTLSTDGLTEGDPITLKQVFQAKGIEEETLKVSFARALQNTMQHSLEPLEEEGDKQTLINQLSDDIAEKVVNYLFGDHELYVVKLTDIPRNMTKGSHVYINPKNKRDGKKIGINQATYEKIVENAKNQHIFNRLRKETREVTVVVKGENREEETGVQIHHTIPLYLGGTHELENLLAAFGQKVHENLGHGMMHKVIDDLDLEDFGLGAVKLTSEGLNRKYDESKLKVLFGTLYNDGKIIYKETEMPLKEGS